MLVRLGFAVLLTSATIALAPTPASAATSLGALWQLDETSGTTAVDSSGNANHGTLNGGPARISGRFGRSLRFDGVDDNVFIPRSATLEPATVTVEGWVRAGASPGTFRHIVSQGAYSCEVASYGLTTGAGGGIGFYVSNGSDDFLALSPEAPATVWNGAWHHVAGTYDGATVRLFVDGAEVGTGTATAIPIGYGLPNPAGLLGAFGGTCSLNWAGDLDAPRVWGRALSAEELAASAAMGAPGTSRLDERIDASQAIVYTSDFSNGRGMKVSIESATGTEKISSIRLRGVLPGLLGLASCRDDLLALLNSTCSITLSNGAKTATLTARRLNILTSGVTLRVTLSSGRTFDVDVET